MIRAALLLTALALPARAVELPAGTPVALATLEPLSSKTHQKGDRVRLEVAEDVMAGGSVVLARGTPATGEIADARAKGAMGMSGYLVVRPLWTGEGDTIVRLAGDDRQSASVTGGAVVGMVLLTPGFTGRSATIPAGHRIAARTLKSVEVALAPR